MDPFWLVVVVGVIGYVVYHARGASPTPKHGCQAAKSGGRTRKRVEPDWLLARWTLAEQLKGSDSDFFPRWYYDPMTEHQARRLDEERIDYSRSITKGQASDLIGLREPPDPTHLEIMRFFKRPTRGVKETQARHEVAVIFAEEANQRRWAERPMDARQREFFRFFGVKVRAGLSHLEAEELVAETLKRADGSGDSIADHWSVYEQVLDDLEDPEFREDYGIKKPSMSAVRKGVESLVKDSTPWSDITSDLVVERLVDANPDLEH